MDTTRAAGYVLLSYELPLERWLGDARLTPYLGSHFYVPDRRHRDQIGTIHALGLNFKPVTVVVLKAEFARVTGHLDDIGRFDLLQLQMAVLF